MTADGTNLREDDRLPWLETVEPDEPDGPPLGRVVALVLLGLAILAAIVFGIYRLQHRQPAAEGELIQAQEGDYKIKPEDPGGMKVTGEGSAAVATSAGKTGNGAIDLKQVPETPVAGKRAPPAPAKAQAAPPAGRNAVAQVPASGGKLVAQAPVAAAQAAAPHAAAAGSMVQLGAYPSEGAANAAWAGYAKRFGYLSALGKTVQPVSAGGKTLYRLRVNAGGANQAADLCGRLKVAGQGCFVAG